MPVTTQTISPQQKQDMIIEQMLLREAEIHAYQMNIDNYTNLLSTLPSTWPDNLVQYRGQNPQQIATQNVSPADAAALALLMQRDRFGQLLTTEIIHQSTVQSLYDALAAQIPADQLPSLLTTAAAANAAQDEEPQTPSA